MLIDNLKDRSIFKFFERVISKKLYFVLTDGFIEAVDELISGLSLCCDGVFFIKDFKIYKPLCQNHRMLFRMNFIQRFIIGVTDKYLDYVCFDFYLQRLIRRFLKTQWLGVNVDIKTCSKCK